MSLQTSSCFIRLSTAIVLLSICISGISYAVPTGNVKAAQLLTGPDPSGLKPTAPYDEALAASDTFQEFLYFDEGHLAIPISDRTYEMKINRVYATVDTENAILKGLLSPSAQLIFEIPSGPDAYPDALDCARYHFVSINGHSGISTFGPIAVPSSNLQSSSAHNLRFTANIDTKWLNLPYLDMSISNCCRQKFCRKRKDAIKKSINNNRA